MSSPFDYKKQLANLPHKPGVYQYYDAAGLLIYIGKAKDLRQRVASYFVDSKDHPAKTRVLVSKIQQISFTIVETELEALLLENNLIKQHQPRYNVLLKDDKTYPSIAIKKEDFPRVLATRKLIKDGSTYFGPYASLPMMHAMLDLIRQLFPLRSCKLALTQANIKAGKFKVCLEYQIGNCLGPCEGKQSAFDYAKSIDQIKAILKGNTSAALQYLAAERQKASNSLDFERAHKLHKQHDLLQGYQHKSAVVSIHLGNMAVFSIASDASSAFVNYLKVMKGSIVQTQTIELKKRLDESDEQLLALAIAEFSNRFGLDVSEMIVPFSLGLEDQHIQFTVPKAGDKLKLLQLSQKNVFFFRKQKLAVFEKLYPDHKSERILTQLQRDLRLKVLPRHIECFDNANFQGSNPVSAMVVFKNGKPSKKDYRHYNIRTVIGANDCATMEEVLQRRYSRMIAEKTPMPDLIIVDGGKGQLAASVKVLQQLGLYGKVAIIALAKRLEEIYYPFDAVPLYIDKRSESLRLIQYLRDEAHRFGNTHHRKRRDKETLQTQLTEIPGIGSKTATKLLRHFKSVKQIRLVNKENLLTILTKKQAMQVLSYFESQPQTL